MKLKLRKEMTEKRNNLSEKEFLAWSKEICKTIWESKLYIEATRIFCFVSMGKEASTYPLLERALAEGKSVCVPIAKKKDGMYFVQIQSLLELEKGSFGVMEPKIGKEKAVSPTVGDVFLIPGLVFDVFGNRYGYGGGFYDRYLQEYHQVERWAIAFSFQVTKEKLEVEPFDIPMDKIVTEKGIVEVDK